MKPQLWLDRAPHFLTSQERGLKVVGFVGNEDGEGNRCFFVKVAKDSLVNVYVGGRCRSRWALAAKSLGMVGGCEEEPTYPLWRAASLSGRKHLTHTRCVQLYAFDWSERIARSSILVVFHLLPLLLPSSPLTPEPPSQVATQRRSFKSR